MSTEPEPIRVMNEVMMRPHGATFDEKKMLILELTKEMGLRAEMSFEDKVNNVRILAAIHTDVTTATELRKMIEEDAEEE